MVQTAAASLSCRSIVKALFGFEDFQEVVDEARVERDRDRLAVVGDRELDARLADFGGLAGEDELPSPNVKSMPRLSSLVTIAAWRTAE